MNSWVQFKIASRLRRQYQNGNFGDISNSMNCYLLRNTVIFTNAEVIIQQKCFHTPRGRINKFSSFKLYVQMLCKSKALQKKQFVLHF